MVVRWSGTCTLRERFVIASPERALQDQDHGRSSAPSAGRVRISNHSEKDVNGHHGADYRLSGPKDSHSAYTATAGANWATPAAPLVGTPDSYEAQLSGTGRKPRFAGSVVINGEGAGYSPLGD
jgi:hypothetical protein